MITYFNDFTFGSADPFLPHFILLSVSIAAAFAVGFGIILESPRYSESVHRVATWLVLGGIAVESLCTVLLFVFDECISNLQQSKIVALDGEMLKAKNNATAADERIANLLKENSGLERDLAPRDINMFPVAKSVLGLKNLSLFMTVTNEEEPIKTASQIFNAFTYVGIGDSRSPGVTLLPTDPSIMEGVTLRYAKPISEHEETDGQRVAIAICESLKQQGLSTRTERFPIDVPSLAKEWPSNAPTSAVIIRVGRKPNLFWWNKQLRAEGKREQSDTSACTQVEKREIDLKR